MVNNFDNFKTKIVEELKKRAPNLKCSACGSGAIPNDNPSHLENLLIKHRMVLIDGFFNRSIQNVDGHFKVGNLWAVQNRQL